MRNFQRELDKLQALGYHSRKGRLYLWWQCDYATPFVKWSTYC